MEVIINQKKVAFANGSSLKEVLVSYGVHQSNGVAVAVNSQVVPKTVWEAHLLQTNDRITIIKAAQGG